MSEHTILVVEGNPTTREVVTLALGRRGHHVLDAPDGVTALELARRHQPVVVLQDLVLPDFDGFALPAELRKHARGTMAVLALSGFTSRNDEARISAVGFDDVIVKPIEPSRLIPIVEAHLPAASSSSEPFGAGRHLVVVDDDPIQLKLTRFRLEKLGFSVEMANDGREALELLRGTSPDGIISDILMPNLDGFGLALAVRRDPKIQHLPILLVTSSYVADLDRDLARRAGANDLILRTPEHREVVQALRTMFSKPTPRFPPPVADLAAIEGERTRRLVQQLERHVLVNTGLSRRTSALSAELAVLTRISEAVLRHQNVEVALDEAVAACFDAGGISIGALYLLNDDDMFRVRPLGSKVTWTPGDLESFFGNEALLRRIMAGGQTVKLGPPDRPSPEIADLLRRCDASAIMVVPLVHFDRPIGALFMAADSQELDQEDWAIFAQGVGNQIAQALAIARAFAQRETAEQRARDQERLAHEQSDLLQLILDHAPDVITRLDRDGVITFINQVTPPHTRDQIVGTPWLSHVPAEYHQLLSQALEAVLTAGETNSHELMVTDAGGRTESYSRRISPVFSDGVATGAIVIDRIITQEKKREAQLIVSDRMASIGTLAAGVAHEINNPLAAVIANVEMAAAEATSLAARSGDASMSDCLNDALEAAERIRLIVRDLKVFSRSDEDSTGAIDVHSVLESTLRVAWNEIRHRARLVKDFKAVPLVDGNKSRLGQVFLNLIVNAAQAIPEGRVDGNEIRVTTRTEAGMVAVDVADTGAGMSDEIQRRLFTPFFTTKPVGVGTGLGLSICQRIVSAMKGQLRVHSRPGAGSTFTVLLPPSVPAPPPMPVTGRMGRVASRRGRILVVDDDRVVATVIQRSVGGEHDVVATLSAMDALSLVRGGQIFDVILCDLMMPQMTGMDLHAALAGSHPDQARRMIFLTGGAFTAGAREFLDGTPNLTVEKPFSVRQLRALVNERIG
jgi:PAS domain S-box-containing protein